MSLEAATAASSSPRPRSTTATGKPFLQKNEEPTSGLMGAEWLGVVVLLIAAFVWVLFLLRKRSPGGAGGNWLGWMAQRNAAERPMRLTSRLAVTPQTVLVSVAWGEEELLLGCTAQSVAVLARRPQAAASTTPAGESGGP